MLVPRFVENFDEPDAALDEPAGEQAGVRKRTFARLGAVHLEGLFRFLGNVHQLRRGKLHAIRQLERVDARGDFGIADDVEMFLIEPFDGVE